MTYFIKYAYASPAYKELSRTDLNMNGINGALALPLFMFPFVHNMILSAILEYLHT